VVCSGSHTVTNRMGGGRRRAGAKEEKTSYLQFVLLVHRTGEIGKTVAGEGRGSSDLETGGRSARLRGTYNLEKKQEREGDLNPRAKNDKEVGPL